MKTAGPLLSSSQLYPAGRIGDSALFFIDCPPSARGLRRSNGTAPGAELLVPDLVTPEPFEPSASIAYGGRVLFSACDASALRPLCQRRQRGRDEPLRRMERPHDACGIAE